MFYTRFAFTLCTIVLFGISCHTQKTILVWYRLCTILVSSKYCHSVTRVCSRLDNSHNITSVTSARCHVTYGNVLDRNIRRNISICGDLSSQRSRNYVDEAPTRHIYTSTSNHLHITVNNSADNRFMIRLEG